MRDESNNAMLAVKVAHTIQAAACIATLEAENTTLNLHLADLRQWVCSNTCYWHGSHVGTFTDCKEKECRAAKTPLNRTEVANDYDKN